MPYISQQEIIDSIGESDFVLLADRDCDGDVDAAVVARAIAAAESEVSSYVGQRYALPLATTPPILIQVTIDVAVYRLADTPDKMTDERRRRYEDARGWLTKLAHGTVRLDVPLVDTPSTVHGGVFRRGPDKIFTRDGLKGVY